MANYICEKKENNEQNGIELYFSVYPLTGTKETLKNYGFRWNHKKSCWYAKRGAMADEIATICAETTLDEYRGIASRTGETVTEIKPKAEKATSSKPKTAKKPTATANKYGVKVGDFFTMQWGYEQTNNSFFQVVSLVGTSSVRVREVSPNIIETSAQSGMSEHRTYNLDTSVILPPRSSVFIKDNENGDLKRIKSYMADGVSNPQINIASYADAYHTTEKALELYESWYY